MSSFTSMNPSPTKLSKDDQKRLLAQLMTDCTTPNKITLIKRIRELSNMGLADAKDFVEKNGFNQGQVGSKLYENLRIGLRNFLSPTYTKEQFLGILATAIDNAESMYTDPLDAVLYMCENLKKRGGLDYAAAKDEEFVDSI